MTYDNDDVLQKRLQKIANEQLGNDAVDPESQKEQRFSQAEQILSLVTPENCELFHDQFDEPCAHILVKNHWENHKMKSKKFKHWLSRLLWEKSKKVVSPTAVQSALAILEGKACFEGKLYPLDTRVAIGNDAIWYDLCNDKWQAVKVTGDGWEVVDHPPILFCRYSHQQAQVLPVEASIEDIKKLQVFLNLAKPEYIILFLVYLVTCFIPEIAHPIPIIFGPKGAAKSTFANILSKLIDPSIQGVSGMPADHNEVIRQLYHHRFRFFDNMSTLSASISDLFCRAVTGDGFSKRALYSDDDDIIFNFKHCIGLNGINNCAQKPDLLDRSLLFRLESISDEKRRGDTLLWSEFEEIKPKALGSIFTVLSLAMRLRNSIQIKSLPRMGDFTLWGCAIAQAMGFNQDVFLSAYKTNRDEQNEEAIQESPVALALTYFMKMHDVWSGTPSELLDALDTVAKNQKLDSPGNKWPKSASTLSRKLNEVIPNLAHTGINVEFERKASTRTFTIRKVIKDAVTSDILSAIDRVKAVFGDGALKATDNIPSQYQSRTATTDDRHVANDDTSQIPF